MIWTIGHSNHHLDRFIALLKGAGISVLVDVRSAPYSRRFPHFGRERLMGSLTEAGIDYLWEGAALGGRPATGEGYDALATGPDFRLALGRLAERGREANLCLMCSEKNPLDCHRTLLVSRRLVEQGADIEHLLADGSRRPHRDIEDDLLADAVGGDLFEDRSMLLARAYQRREAGLKSNSSRLVSGASSGMR